MMVSPAFLLLLFPCLARPATAQQETPFQKFQRQHVDTNLTWEPDPTRYCNQMMSRRNMTVPICKELNSFIHGQLEEIVAVCGAGGTRSHDNFYYSNAPFNVTDCNLKSSIQPPCSYSGEMNGKRICVACTSGNPVHYARTSVCTKREVC